VSRFAQRALNLERVLRETERRDVSRQCSHRSRAGDGLKTHHSRAFPTIVDRAASMRQHAGRVG
jgi:hypothetical protein